MTQLKEMMFDIKNKWENNEFDDFYNGICFGARGDDVFDVINLEAYIYQAVQSGAYQDPNARGMGSIILGFMFGDILKHELTSGNWVFNANPSSWSDFYISYRTKKGAMGTVMPFSAVTRFIEACRKHGEAALKGEDTLQGLLKKAKGV